MKKRSELFLHEGVLLEAAQPGPQDSKQKMSLAHNLI
jgi:hypothetical protein